MGKYKLNTISILGCGWLGKSLGISLISKGYFVKGSTTTFAKLESLKKVKISPFLVDISQDEIDDDFLQSEFLIIAITSKNIDDFIRLITKIEQSKIKKVIFISSTSVYPNLNKVMREEDANANHTLAVIENLFRKNTSFKTTIVRFAGLFGGDRHPANWFQNGRKISQPNGFVNMIHRDDCIAILEEVIAQNCFGDTFNACSHQHPTRKEFYEIARKSKGIEPPVFEEKEVLSWKIISSEKLEKALNYQCKIGIIEGLNIEKDIP